MTTPDETEKLMNELAAKTPGELEQLRTEMLRQINAVGEDNVELALLRRFAFISSTLRRRNSGPPRTTKKSPSKGAKQQSLDVLDSI